MTVKKKVFKGAENNTEIIEGDIFNLLAGYRDENGTVHKEFEIVEMTGAEEEAIAKPEIRTNGAKVVRTILEKCCIRIGTLTRRELGLAKWREIIQNLHVGDQDYMMLMIRKQSIGEEVEASHDCPKCKTKLITTVGLDELEIMPFKGQEEINFELPKGYRDKKGEIHKIGKIRLPKGLDREVLDPIARKNIGEATTLMLTRCVESFEGVNVNNDVIRGLSIKDREYLAGLLKDNIFGVKFEIDIICDTCGTEFKASLNMLNFI